MPRKFEFIPTISFDGVAIGIAIVAGSIAWGKISSKVDNLTEQSRMHTEQISGLTASSIRVATILDTQIKVIAKPQ